MPSIVDFGEVQEAAFLQYTNPVPLLPLHILNIALKKHPRAFVKNKNANIFIAEDQISNHQGQCGSPLHFCF